MENYKGGYQIIDVSGLGNLDDLVGGEVYTIEDESLLKTFKYMFEGKLQGAKPKIPLIVGIIDDDLFDGVSVGRISYSTIGITIYFKTPYTLSEIRATYEIDEETQELIVSGGIVVNYISETPQAVEDNIVSSIDDGALKTELAKKLNRVNTNIADYEESNVGSPNYYGLVTFLDNNILPLRVRLLFAVSEILLIIYYDASKGGFYIADDSDFTDEDFEIQEQWENGYLSHLIISYVGAGNNPFDPESEGYEDKNIEVKDYILRT